MRSNLQNQVAYHWEKLSELSRPGEALDPYNAPTATINNPSWFDSDGATPERREVHKHIRSEWLGKKPNVGHDKIAIIMIGPPGSGKSTLLDPVLAERGLNRDHVRIIDADEFKGALLDQALLDGSFESFIKPQAIKDLEAHGEQFFPLELASLVHEESSQLADAARFEAIAAGENIVIDAVMSNPRSAADLARTLDHAGYSIHVVAIEVPYEVSANSARMRWEKGYLQGLSGENPQGGRWVPEDYIRKVFTPDNGLTGPQMSLQEFADCPAVVQIDIYQRGFPGAPPGHTLTSRMNRATPETPITAIDLATLDRPLTTPTHDPHPMLSNQSTTNRPQIANNTSAKHHQAPSAHTRQVGR